MLCLSCKIATVTVITLSRRTRLTLALGDVTHTRRSSYYPCGRYISNRKSYGSVTFHVASEMRSCSCGRRHRNEVYIITRERESSLPLKTCVYAGHSTMRHGRHWNQRVPDNSAASLVAYATTMMSRGELDRRHRRKFREANVRVVVDDISR